MRKRLCIFLSIIINKLSFLSNISTTKQEDSDFKNYESFLINDELLHFPSAKQGKRKRD
jgi:hypothetical protein